MKLLTEEVIEFGEVKNGSYISKAVKFRNDFDYAINFKTVKTSCGSCTSALQTNAPKVMEPGDEAVFILRYQPTPNQEGNITKTNRIIAHPVGNSKQEYEIVFKFTANVSKDNT